MLLLVIINNNPNQSLAAKRSLSVMPTKYKILSKPKFEIDCRAEALLKAWHETQYLNRQYSTLVNR